MNRFVSNMYDGAVSSRLKSGYLLAALVVAVCSTLCVLLRSHLTLTDLAMIYLLGVIAVSMRTSRRVAVINSFVSVFAFHYFCVPYHDSFVLTETVYVSTLFGMLAVSLVISYLTSRIRAEAASARDAEVQIQTERMKNSLLSAVSHDVKTPLASIYGAATSLVEQGDWLDAADRSELAKNIVTEAARLNRVVSNILEMTRIDAGVEIKKDWQSVEEIVGAALGHVESLLSGRQILTSIPSDMPLIRVDDVLIEQVLINLLENITKYTPPDTPIEITGYYSEKSVVISVRDHGPGFPPGDEERIFEKFFRGSTDGVKGIGLGLAICRAIVQAHDGTIRAGTKKDAGATIFIELPIGGAQPQIVSAEDF
jgi:K+-sensing histidine kinase KdpD